MFLVIRSGDVRSTVAAPMGWLSGSHISFTEYSEEDKAENPVKVCGLVGNLDEDSAFVVLIQLALPLESHESLFILATTPLM